MGRWSMSDNALQFESYVWTQLKSDPSEPSDIQRSTFDVRLQDRVVGDWLWYK
jgi:hypothetical protein